MPTITAMTWFVRDPEATAAFYRSLGVSVIEPVEDDATYMFCLDPVLIQLWPASEQSPPMPGISITLSVDPALLDRFPSEEKVTPRGCIAVEDPDGNRVLLTARRDVGDVSGDII